MSKTDSPLRTTHRGSGEPVQYGTAACRLGRVLVAATAHGLCAVLPGNDDKLLIEELQRRFPGAAPAPDQKAIRSLLAEVVARIDHTTAPGTTLPLDLRGTAFQRKVWDALQDIPPGHTTSYGELAKRVGLPGGARAVAQACGANPAAVIVPCHRVVAADGGLGGYRWGVERKRALLESERLDA